MSDYGNKMSPLRTVAHVRSWLTAHPEAKVGPSGDWELPRRPDAESIDALRCLVRDTLESARVKDAAIVTAILVADIVDNFELRLKESEESAWSEAAT